VKRVLVAFCLLLTMHPALGADRFGRQVVQMSDPKSYEVVKRDDVGYAVRSNERFSVECLVYRGRENYYVEVNVMNKTNAPVTLPALSNFINFDKPGYTVQRIDTMEVAKRSALAAGVRFTPTPPPYVPPTYNTTVNATATTYGNQTNISGTATTRADNSGQAGANIGNAVGNAIAAHRFYKAQRTEVAFSHFLAAHVQTDFDTALEPAQSRSIVATFEQLKPKKKPFMVTVAIGTDTFRFDYKE
jgi:hypothetical protein